MIYNNINYEMLVLKARHNVIKNKVRFVNFHFVFNKCFNVNV